jgi:hypothetical protein
MKGGSRWFVSAASSRVPHGALSGVTTPNVINSTLSNSGVVKAFLGSSVQRLAQGCKTSKLISVKGFGWKGLLLSRGQEPTSPGSRVLKMYSPGGNS